MQSMKIRYRQRLQEIRLFAYKVLVDLSDNMYAAAELRACIIAILKTTCTQLDPLRTC